MAATTTNDFFKENAKGVMGQLEMIVDESGGLPKLNHLKSKTFQFPDKCF